jgi:hypothetical protein
MLSYVNMTGQNITLKFDTDTGPPVYTLKGHCVSPFVLVSDLCGSAEDTFHACSNEQWKKLMSICASLRNEMPVSSRSSNLLRIFHFVLDALVRHRRS